MFKFSLFLILGLFVVSAFAGWAHCNITDGLQREYSIKGSNITVEVVNLLDYGDNYKDIVANIHGNLMNSLYKYCNFTDNAQDADYKILLRIFNIEDNDNLGGAAGRSDKITLEVQIFNSQRELLRKLLIDNRTSKADPSTTPSDLTGVFSYIYRYILSSETKGDLRNYRYRYTRREVNENRVVE